VRQSDALRRPPYPGPVCAELDPALIAADERLPWSDWSLRPEALAALTLEVRGGRRELVECGAGVSTIVLARALREGGGRLHSLEHDPAWAAMVRSLLAAEGLDGVARVIDAPLRPHPLAPGDGEWYASDALAALPASGIDLLLVDGPPAGEPEIQRRRYPALPMLAPRLAPHAIIVLDDASRPGEAWALDRWERATDFRFDRRGPGGLATGRRTPAPRP
jgi:predicted O-methyltransferase YrrM